MIPMIEVHFPRLPPMDALPFGSYLSSLSMPAIFTPMEQAARIYPRCPSRLCTMVHGTSEEAGVLDLQSFVN